MGLTVSRKPGKIIQQLGVKIDKLKWLVVR